MYIYIYIYIYVYVHSNVAFARRGKTCHDPAPLRETLRHDAATPCKPSAKPSKETLSKPSRDPSSLQLPFVCYALRSIRGPRIGKLSIA